MMESDVAESEAAALLPETPSPVHQKSSPGSTTPTPYAFDEGEGWKKASKASSASGYGTLARQQSLQDVTPVGISWHNVGVKHEKSGKQILSGVSGMAEPGQLVALMGSSGAGKTTLLNTLMARNLHGLVVSGTVLVDGRVLGKEITSVSGYVQQNDLFMSTVTVREHLEIQASLRLVGFTPWQIKRRVAEVLRELGLSHCQNFMIGRLAGGEKGISGGEARRLLFASELLNNPALLFCDEPTTGLDSSMAVEVISMLRRLAKSGRTIICTIHQPSSSVYRKFTRVMFLAQGRLAYFGEPAKAVEMFSRFGYSCPPNYNPADLIIEKLSIEPRNEEVCRERTDKLCASFDESPEAAAFREKLADCRSRMGKYPDVRRTARFSVQTRSLLRRSLIDNWRNKALARAKILQKLIMGIFVGLLYWQTPLSAVGINNMNGAMFYLVSELTYSTLFGILTFLPADFPLVVREYHDGLYSVGSYYIARSLSYVPLFALDGLIMVSIAYWMAGFVPTLGRFLIVLVISVLVEQSAAAFGVMLSSAAPSFPVAVSIAGPILTLLSMTGGLYANVGELPKWIRWISYLSWFKYGFEAFSISQWEGASSRGACLGESSSNGTIICQSPESILHNFSFSPANFEFDLIAMLTCLLTFYLIGLAEISCTALMSLWRAFRGRKWNPLRERVDSVELDFREVFIATLFFIIVCFLLPTILVYYAVFTPLWTGVNFVCRASEVCARTTLGLLFHHDRTSHVP